MQNYHTILCIGVGFVGYHIIPTEISAKIIMLDDPLDFYEQPKGLSFLQRYEREPSYVLVLPFIEEEKPLDRHIEIVPATQKRNHFYVEEGFTPPPKKTSRPPPPLEEVFFYV